MHGGLSPQLGRISEIHSIVRPTDIPDEGIVCDLLWSDPTGDETGWAPSERGVSYTFGPDVTQQFTTSNDIDVILRAHQVVEDGYEFSHKRQCITVFSAPNYCG